MIKLQFEDFMTVGIGWSWFREMMHLLGRPVQTTFAIVDDPGWDTQCPNAGHKEHLVYVERTAQMWCIVKTANGETQSWPLLGKEWDRRGVKERKEGRQGQKLREQCLWWTKVIWLCSDKTRTLSENFKILIQKKNPLFQYEATRSVTLSFLFLQERSHLSC